MLPALRNAAKRLWRLVSPETFKARFWERRGKVYAGEGMSRAYEALYEEVAGLCAEAAPDSVLEFGCGYGYGLSRVADRSPGSRRLVGIDLSSTQLASARKFFPRGEYHAADLARPLPFSEPFDVVTGVSVLMYLPPADLAAALRELHRLCRRRLVVAEYSWHDLDAEGRRRFESAFSYDGRSIHDLRAALADVGFSKVEVRPVRAFADPALNPAGELPMTLFLAQP